MKGKRNLVFQVNGLEVDYAALKKAIEKELKANGIKYSDDVDMYFKASEGVVYCVVGDRTVKVYL